MVLMSVLRNLLSVRLVLGSAPECWDGKLRSAALLGAVLFGVFYFAALLQLNDPLEMFRPEAVSWRAWVSWAAICLPATIFLSSWLLVVLRRAVGYIVFSVSMIYLGPMITAVAISLVAFETMRVALGTAALICISLAALSLAVRNARHDRMVVLAQERMGTAEGVPYLRPVSLAAEPVDLLPPPNLAVTFLEYGMVVLILVLGPGFWIAAITDDLSERGLAASLIWFVMVALFLASRRSVARTLLLARAMALYTPAAGRPAAGSLDTRIRS